MKVIVCGSMKVSSKMVEIKNELAKVGHEVILPKDTEKYADNALSEETAQESTKNKIEGDLIREYYREIETGDAVLIVNETLKGIPNYIGGNSFLELAFGHVLGKKTYLLNSVPEMSYSDEILAMQPVVLNGDLSLIK